ncbi:hypothetical protein Dimus_010080, partial [Dionaea muscipula]
VGFSASKQCQAKIGGKSTKLGKRGIWARREGHDPTGSFIKVPLLIQRRKLQNVSVLEPDSATFALEIASGKTKGLKLFGEN